MLPQPRKKFLSRGTAELSESEQHAMPRFVCAAKVPRLCGESAVLVDSVVGAFQLKGGEIGEHVDEDLIGELEYCEKWMGRKISRVWGSR
jgi:hypothetical protein